MVEQLPRGLVHQISILTPEYSGTPLIQSPTVEKNMAVLTRFFCRKMYGHFAWWPKKVAVITRWLYYRGGCKAGFYCIYYFFLWVPFLAPKNLLLLRSKYLLTQLQSVELNLSDIWHCAIEIDMAQLWSVAVITAKSPFLCVNKSPIWCEFCTPDTTFLFCKAI